MRKDMQNSDAGQTSLQVSKARNPYRMIDIRAIEDTRLSHKAVGLLARLLVKPDGWQVNVRQIISSYPGGERAVRSAMKELEKYGYAKLVPVIHPETNLMMGQRWIVTDYPENEQERTLPKGLQGKKFSETAVLRGSENASLAKCEPRKSAAVTRKTSSTRKQLNTNTHTHNSAGVCADNENENSSTRDAGKANKDRSDSHKSSHIDQGKSSGRCLNIEGQQIPVENIDLIELRDYVSSKVLKYIRTLRKANTLRIPPDHLKESVYGYFKKKAAKNQFEALFYPDPETDKKEFKRWAAQHISGIEYFQSCYIKNHGEDGSVYKTAPR